MQTLWIHMTNDAVMRRQVGDFYKPNDEWSVYTWKPFAT